MSEYYSSSPSSLSSLIQDPISNPNPNPTNSSKRKRNLCGTPDPDAEVIALSPRSLTAKNRFTCEICNKGFQRDQNLQLHRRGHNLPWKLKQGNKLEAMKKKVYICPETSCVHHDPSRALGDLTGVKKHFSRKHGEKKWKCDKCSKKYAVHSDWKAHNKICGTKEYRCDCGAIFNRKDSFITHRAFCHALIEENSRMASFSMMMSGGDGGMRFPRMLDTNLDMNLANPILPIWLDQKGNDSHFENPSNSLISGCSSLNNNNGGMLPPKTVQWLNNYSSSTTRLPVAAHMSATGMLHKATQTGLTPSIDPININRFGVMDTNLSNFDMLNYDNDEKLMMMAMMNSKQIKENGVDELPNSDFTRDFLGVGGNERTFNLQQGLFKFNS